LSAENQNFPLKVFILLPTLLPGAAATWFPTICAPGHMHFRRVAKCIWKTISTLIS